MSDIILSGFTLQELLGKIETLLDSKITAGIALTRSSPTSYLSRKDACELLKVSLPTLRSWTKEGLIQCYKIGNRVLYKKEDIELSLESLMTYKFKRGTK